MQTSVRRAAAFAAVATMVLATPALGAASAVPFALLAVSARLVSRGPLFELFARPADRVAGQLRGLTGFALAATGLGLLVALSSLPAGVFVATVLLVGYGNLAGSLVPGWRDAELERTGAFVLAGAVAATGGQLFVGEAIPAEAAFLAVLGGLVGGLARTSLGERDDPLVMLSIALPLWLFAGLGVEVDPVGLMVAVALTGTFGYLSYALGTASVPGMLAGVTIGLLTLVIGGYGWFAMLIAFFGLGGVATKYRYEEKRASGTAEPNRGARGSRNVLGNATVSLAAVVGLVASPHLPLPPDVFLFAFAGSVATAMSDTLSSEIGVLFGDPRLITTFQRVEPGTDGGITWQGELAGLAGAAVVAGIADLLLGVGSLGALVILVGGLLGMTVDSFLGAMFEGGALGNQGVNFLATLAGALFGVAGAVVLGLV